MKKYDLNKLTVILNKYIGKENDKDLRRDLMEELNNENINIEHCFLADNHYITNENNNEVYFSKWILESDDVFFILYVIDDIIDSICVDKEEDLETILEVK
jgi:hypothetical protein